MVVDIKKKPTRVYNVQDYVKAMKKAKKNDVIIWHEGITFQTKGE